MVTAQKLISINRLRRASDHLVKAIESVAHARTVGEIGGDLWTAVEVADINQLLSTLESARVKVGTLANDLQQRLDEQKAESARIHLLSRDLGARPC